MTCIEVYGDYYDDGGEIVSSGVYIYATELGGNVQKTPSMNFPYPKDSTEWAQGAERKFIDMLSVDEEMNFSGLITADSLRDGHTEAVTGTTVWDPLDALKRMMTYPSMDEGTCKSIIVFDSNTALGDTRIAWEGEAFPLKLNWKIVPTDEDVPSQIEVTMSFQKGTDLMKEEH